MGGKGDLSQALKLLASGRSVEDVWSEAGFTSAEHLTGEILSLAEKISTRQVRLVAYSDGASIGNPGEAGCGIVIMDHSGRTIVEDYKYLGRMTNNAAEYEGAILALKRAADLGAKMVELRVDSSLLANQIKGGYRVKSKNLAHLYQELKRMAEQFEDFKVTLIARNQNKQADRLANLAIAAHKGG